MIQAYDWRGGSEAMVRFGPAAAPVVVVALPPFEEANRTRTLAVAMLRALAEDGIAGALPDLPAQGESLLPTEAACLADWRAAFTAAVETLPQPRFALSIRAGALIDGEAAVHGRWSLSPQTGAELVRELHRIRRAGEAAEIPSDAIAEVAGNRIAAALLDDLASAKSGGIDRTLRLDGDARAADHRLPFPPPWRRAEPDCDAALARALAADVAHWVRTCAD
ncbi:hypothetical protein ACBY01_11300 [Sphingomonas sp. ac-8]|uniref:hypothetical protein n=1 Tax=Sphingomonas sp. ac-8 TaxID=3242977 RepID=UPI003A804CF2